MTISETKPSVEIPVVQTSRYHMHAKYENGCYYVSGIVLENV